VKLSQTAVPQFYTVSQKNWTATISTT